VDNGSRDDVASIARHFPVRCLHVNRLSRAMARNAGLRATNCDLLIFLDATDRLDSDALATVRTAFSAHPDIAFALEGNGTDPGPCPESHADLLRRIGDSRRLAVWRRVALMEIGGFPEAPGDLSDTGALLASAWQRPGIRLSNRLGSSMAVPAPSDPLAAVLGGLDVLARLAARHAPLPHVQSLRLGAWHLLRRRGGEATRRILTDLLTHGQIRPLYELAVLLAFLLLPGLPRKKLKHPPIVRLAELRTGMTQSG